jgi:tight adherence protein C
MGFLDTINTKLIDLLGPFGPLIAILMLGVLLILLVLPTMLQKQPDPLDKLKANNTARDASGPINWTNIPAFWNQKTKKNILRSN